MPENENKPIPGIDDENTKGISKLKISTKKVVAILSAGAIALIGLASCNSCNKETNENQKGNNLDKDKLVDEDASMNTVNKIDTTEKVTTATVKEDGKIELDDNDENELETNENESETLEDETSQVNRTVVTASDIQNVVENSYNYFDSRIEDLANQLALGDLYSTVWLANSQFISQEETEVMINSGYIPSDLTTLKTEVDNVMSLIISENASKVAVAQAWGTELDMDKLIDIDCLFIDEIDKNVAKYASDEYRRLITLTSREDVFACYENTRNFFNNTTKYDFAEIESEAQHFNHDYPTDFTQTSIGAQYLVKGIIGPQFLIYASGANAISNSESAIFQETVDNVEGPISYLDDKFNGICFENAKTLVK